MQYLITRLTDKEWFAFPTSHVIEIIEAQPIIVVPQEKKQIQGKEKGFIHFRNKVIPIVRIPLSEHKNNSTPIMVIIQLDNEKEVVIEAQEVNDIVNIASENISHYDSIFEKPSPYISAIAKLEQNKLVSIVNLNYFQF